MMATGSFRLAAALILGVSVAACAQPKAPRPSEQRFWVGDYIWGMAGKGYSAQTAVGAVFSRKNADYLYLDLAWGLLEPQPGEYQEEYVNDIHKVLRAGDESGGRILLALHHLHNPHWAPWSKFFTDEIQQRLRTTWKMLAGEVKQHPSLWAYMMMCEDRGPKTIAAKTTEEWTSKYFSFANGVAEAIRQADSKRPIVASPNGLLFPCWPRRFDGGAFQLVQLLRGADSQVDFLDGHHYPNGWWVERPRGERRKKFPDEWRNLNPIADPVFYNLGTVFRSYSAIALRYPRFVHEVGAAVPRGKPFGDDEKLLMFERAMTVLYDMGVSGMAMYGGRWGFQDPKTYSPKLLEFRNRLIATPRPKTYDVLVATNRGLPQIYDAELSGQINPVFRVLEEAGYGWFLTSVTLADQLKKHCKTVLRVRQFPRHNVTAEQVKAELLSQLEGIEPSGRRFPYAGNSDFRYSMTGLTCSIPVAFEPNEGVYDAVELLNGKVRLYARPQTEVTMWPKDGASVKGVAVNGRETAFTRPKPGAVRFRLCTEAALGSTTHSTWDIEVTF